MLQVEDLRKAFNGRTAVDGVSFSISEGEIFGLLGPNGAGKSTTIALIAGLLRPGGGRVLVGGFDPQVDPMQVRRLIGVVPQDVALYPTLSARENLVFWGQMYGLSYREAKARAQEVLAIVDLAARGGDRIETYSGGMKRRINIAAGLMHRPSLLIMDEPTVGIDPQSRHHILETVKELNQSHGMAVLYTSHYMEEVEAICGRVAVMDSGKIIAMGTLGDLHRRAGGRDVLRIRCAAVPEEPLGRLQDLRGVDRVSVNGDVVEIVCAAGRWILADAIGALTAAGAQVQSVQIQEPNLETLFLQLTGKGLRD